MTHRGADQTLDFVMNSPADAVVLHIKDLAARLAEAERDIAQWKKVYDLRGRALQRPCINCGHVPLVIHADAARATDSADDGTKHHPNCTPPCGICEPDEWEKQFLASGVDPVDGI